MAALHSRRVATRSGGDYSRSRAVTVLLIAAALVGSLAADASTSTSTARFVVGLDDATVDDTTRSHRQLTLGECADTENGATDEYGLTCDHYASYPSWCGCCDDEDFFSDDMCCACGGGLASASPTEAPTITTRPSISPAPTPSPTSCFDTDDGAFSGDGVSTCASWYDSNPNDCGGFDDFDFSANDMCCVCGGGSASASPTGAPTITSRPSSSPAPTVQVVPSSIEVTAYPQLRSPIANMEEGEELRFSLTLDVTFPNQIFFTGDRSVKLAGNEAASRPTLCGGYSRFFQLSYGASLQLTYLTLAEGYAQDSGGDSYSWGSNELKGGALFIDDATLILIDCIIRGCYSDHYVRRLRTVGLSSRVAAVPCVVACTEGGGCGCGMRQSRITSLSHLTSPPPPPPLAHARAQCFFRCMLRYQGGALFAYLAILTIMRTKFLDNTVNVSGPLQPKLCMFLSPNHLLHSLPPCLFAHGWWWGGRHDVAPRIWSLEPGRGACLSLCPISFWAGLRSYDFGVRRHETRTTA